MKKRLRWLLCPGTALRSRVSVGQAHAVEGGELSARDRREEQVHHEEERVHVLRLGGRHGNGHSKSDGESKSNAEAKRERAVYSKA